MHGGSKQCRLKLSRLSQITNYDRDRDFPSKPGTTNLFAHLKFGTASVREIYHAIKERVPHPESLLRELYWRDFFTDIAFYFPHVFGQAFRSAYDQVTWVNDPEGLQQRKFDPDCVYIKQ